MSQTSSVLSPQVWYTLESLEKLNIGDKVDFRDNVGKFLLATILSKQNTTLKLHFWGYRDKWDCHCDYTKSLNIYRFAKPNSISGRKANRFTHLKTGDFIDVNPILRFHGWLTAKIKRLDKHSGQIQVIYHKNNRNWLYWIHLDNITECAKYKTMVKIDLRNNHKNEFKLWLCNIVKQCQYLSVFKQCKFNDIRLVQDLNENELQELGVKTLHIPLFMRHINAFKKDVKELQKWLECYGLKKYSVFLDRIGVVTLEIFIGLLSNLKEDCEVLISELNKNNGFPFTVLQRIYCVLNIQTNYFTIKKKENKSDKMSTNNTTENEGLIDEIEGNETCIF